ncbi:Rpn family recombination-promoting nuclease/putative transposase [Desulfococcaceae bacterium HSG8]|nr:Rpn family recombination-promoting nuclease/putative transposase [Desulfococcaceae bacterium HSG8]
MKNPHDKFVKETLTRRENAVSFFREYLPPEIVSQLDWRTLKIAKDSFIKPELEERFSDIVYEIRAKGKTVFIYLLLEHQSSADPWMALRFLRYMLELWELWRKQNPGKRKLPGIIPVLLYHGKDEWKVSVNFQDLFDEPGLTADFIPKFRYLLKDFSLTGDEEIRGKIMLRLFLMLVSKIFSPDFREEFDRIIPLITELSRQETGMKYIETALRYIFHASDAFTLTELETELEKALDEDRKGVIMTIADELRMEGEIKGEIKAYQELLTQGLLPETVAERLKEKIAELTKELENIISQLYTGEGSSESLR